MARCGAVPPPDRREAAVRDGQAGAWPGRPSASPYNGPTEGCRLPAREALWTRDYALIDATGFFSFASFYGLVATLPLLALHLHASVVGVGVVMGSFTVTALIARPFAGRWLDAHPRRRGYVAGAGVMMVATALFPYSGNLAGLVLLRMLQGLGFGLGSTALGALVADTCPAPRRAEGLGFYNNFLDIAMGVGPLAGAALLARMGFRGLFTAAAVVLAVSFLTIAFVRERRRPRVAAAAAARGLIYRPALLPGAIILGVSFAYGAVFNFLPALAQARGLTARSGGIATYAWFYVAYAVVLLLTRGPLGRISDRRGRSVTIVPGLLVLAAGTALLGSVHSLPALLAVAATFGAGFGAAQPSLFAWTVDRADREHWGSAVAMFFAAFDLGVGGSGFLLGALGGLTSYTVIEWAGGAVALAAAAVYLTRARATVTALHRSA